MGNWNDLSIRERADLINMYLDGGVMSLDSMRNHYNSFAEGGDTSYSPSSSIKNYIKRTEAFKSNWYLDGNGIPTVGYGFTGKYYKDKYPNGMTKEQADKEFDRVIDKFAGMVKAHTPNYDSLSQNQKDALLSYMYNVGPGNYTKKSPKFQQALRDKDWNAAASHMDIGYNDRRNPGLRKRRDYERGLFLNGVSEPEKKPDFSKYNYYSAQKERTLASPEIPMAGAVSPVSMPSLYYAQSSPYKDVNFSKPLPEFNYSPEPDQQMQLYKKKNRAVADNNLTSQILSNEEIINDLWSRLEKTENIFAGGGDVDDDFIGPVLKTPSIPERDQEFSINPVQIKAQRSTISVSPTVRPINDLKRDLEPEEDFLLRQQYRDKIYEPVDVTSPSAINNIVTEKESVQKNKELQKMYSLKGEDAKRLQQELADDGYYASILAGYSKDQVKNLQRKLVAKGLLSNEKDANGNYKEVDGIVGAKTRAAFNVYSVDGIIGKNTRAAIQMKDSADRGEVTSFAEQSGVVAQKDMCAKFVKDRFNEGTGNKASDLGVGGNAWNMLKNVERAGGTIVYNVFSGEQFKEATTGNIKSMTSSAMRNNPFDVSTLKPGDIIGIFNPGTTHYAEVLKNGDTYNSHVGICTGYKNGKPIIEHAINGRVIKQTADTVKIAAVARPANINFGRMDIGDSEEQKYFVRGQEDNELLNKYSKGLANSSKYMENIFPEVNQDNIQKIALSVLKRETGYMTNTEKQQRERSKWTNLEYGASDFFKYNIKGETEEDKSTDLGKFKLSSLSQGERQMLGIESPSDLENPTLLARAVTYYLSKNYKYFNDLANKYPELGLTEDDIVNLTTISYNQGLNSLKRIAFDKDGKIAPEKLRAIRKSALNDEVVNDIKSTKWAKLGKPGELLGKVVGYTKSTSYSSSARRERENNIYSKSDIK